MVVLISQNVLSGFKNAHVNKCTHSFAGKQNKVSFKSHQPLRKLEILGAL